MGIGAVKFAIGGFGSFWQVPVWQEKHLLVGFLYVLIEHQSVVQITSTYPKSYNVSVTLSLAAYTVIPY